MYGRLNILFTSRKRGQLLAALLSTLTASLLITGAPAASADTYTASITGTVTGPTGAELTQMWVTAFIVTPSGLSPQESAAVASDGTYTLPGLPAGTYNIEYTDYGYLDSDDVKHPASYLNQWSNGIVLADGQAKTGANIALTPALMIQGRITGPAPDAMSGVCVGAFPVAASVSPSTVPNIKPLGIGEACDGTEPGSPAPDAVVQPDGSYVIGGLPAGTYSVRALPRFYASSAGGLSDVPFVEQWFSGKILRSTAATVIGNAGQTVSGIDFALRADMSFGDVPVGALFHDEITWLGSEGISTGWTEADGSHTYRPVTPVNRDAMAAFLYRLAGSPSFNAPAVSPFTDVATDNPFYKQITWLASTGISTGYPGPNNTKSFQPLSPVNRDAMAAFLYRFAGSPAYTAPASSPFTDVATNNQFYAQINWLADTKITTGWTAPDGTRTFQPVSAVNRDAMAAFMFRYQNMDAQKQ